MRQHIRQAAAILLWRKNTAGKTEVFIVQRSPRLAFFGGFWAFPGGSVEEQDSTTPVLGGSVAAPWVAAAARELFEETGVVALKEAATLNAATRRSLRQQMQHQTAPWHRTLAEQGLHVDGAPFVPFGRWKTPPFSPVTFDAQYLALCLPYGEAPELWPGELTAGLWISPEGALAHHARGDLCLAYPVQATLQILAAANGHIETAAAQAEASTDTLTRRTGEWVPGVRMLPVRTWTLPPATHTNCYILGQNELIIVDPGTPHAVDQNELVAFIDGLVSRGAQVREIWLTHAHPDHTGAAARLRRHFAVPVAAHADTRPSLAQQHDAPVDREIVDDAVFSLEGDFHWRALHTPGHAPGHLCFYETKRRYILSGDNVLGLGSSLVAPSPHGSMRDYMASLDRLLELDLGLLLPGHGPPVATPMATIQRAIQHRKAREQQIIAALTASAQTPEQLMYNVYADVHPQTRPLAIVSLAAHLEKLVVEKVAAAIDGGFARC